MELYWDWQVYGIVTSMMFAILTIAVYIYVKKLRNTLGKCVISCLCSLVMVHILLLVQWLGLMEIYSFLVSLAVFVIAYMIWHSVISYHLWQIFRPLKRDVHQHQFLVYSSFVWTTAAVIVGLFFLMKHFDLVDVFGFQIQGIFNLTMFILTAINIWKVKSEIKRFEQQKETTTTCFDFDTQTYVLFLRISLLMGITWIVLTILVTFLLFDYTVAASVDFVGKVHLCFGILYFVLLILKRSTLKLFMDSIRERRNVRAQMKQDLAQISNHLEKKHSRPLIIQNVKNKDYIA